MTVAARFAANLLRERKRAGLSQERLARLAGLHRTEVGMLERAQRIARIDTLVKLAGALEIGPDELLEGIEWRPGAARFGRFDCAES
jgi:transcriptional regulator with XRE-family HTH domain